MFVKLAVFAFSLVTANAVYNGPLAGGQPASLYPAGVSPQACPNFPNCANPAVAANPNQAAPYGAYPQAAPQYNPQSQYNPQPQYNSQPQYNAQPVPQYNNDAQQRLNRGEYIGDGDYHGEGLAEALAPGYENRGSYAPSYNSAPNYAGVPAGAQQAHGVGQIPAGVSAQACPNYPFCH